MNAPRTIYHLMRADFLERARRYSFLITIGLTIFAAYLYLPPKEAGYLTLGLGNYRGIYNSAWLGGAMAVLCSTLLSLPAFYLVKNAIERDEQTRVGQIIATTPMRKAAYTLGKGFSNFVYLAVMVGVIALSAVGMQFIRGESFTINLWALLAPCVFLVLPAMAMIAALALLFETIPWLRGTFGNVVYCFIWLGILIFTVATIPDNPKQVAEPANDIWGISALLFAMMKDTAAAFPDYMGRFTIGSSNLRAPLQTFPWEGVQWTAKILLGRLLWVGGAVLISLLSALFFKRFDPALEKSAPSRRSVQVAPAGEETRQPAAVVPQVRLSSKPLPELSLPALAVRKIRPRPGWVLLAELRIAFKAIPWWWYLVALGLFAASLFVPTEAARQYLLPVVWLWPLPLWSAMGSREMGYATNQIVFSTPHPLRGQFPMTWFVGVLVAMLTGGGVFINLLLAGEDAHLIAWATGAVFIPSLALALGSWSQSSKLFEVVYLMWWYVGPVNHVDLFDFIGAGRYVHADILSFYWIASGILLILSFLGRLRQIHE